MGFLPLDRATACLSEAYQKFDPSEGENQVYRAETGASLTRGCELGILVRTGAGTRAEAFRYGLVQPR